MSNTSPTALEKFTQHVKDNPDLYFATACGVVSGLFLAKSFGWRKAPKINEAKIVWDWMEKQAKTGFNIYALSNEQKTLWEATWAWVVSESSRTGATASEIVAILTREFVDSRVQLNIA